MLLSPFAKIELTGFILSYIAALGEGKCHLFAFCIHEYSGFGGFAEDGQVVAMQFGEIWGWENHLMNASLLRAPGARSCRFRRRRNRRRSSNFYCSL